jgi:hypothetical protein
MEHSTNDVTETGEHYSRNIPQSTDMSHIKGWAIDANPRNDPTYPIKHRLRDSADRNSWLRPTQQVINTEVLHSNERPSVSAVFGTSAPPSGISGMIRRFAFRYSEGTFAHWLSLLLADRINMVEGLVDDVKKGQLPNLIAEKGLKAEWEHNRPAMIQKAAIGAAVLAVAFVILTHKRDRELD